MFSLPRCAHLRTPSWPRGRAGAPQQFIPSFTHLLWAESVLSTGEAVVPYGDSCFVDTAALPFSASNFQRQPLLLLVSPPCALLEESPS